MANLTNLYAYAYGAEKNYFERNLMEVGGYKRKYTFFSDFLIAESVSGVKGIKETYNSVKRNWISNYEAATELALALNYLAWFWDTKVKNGLADKTNGWKYIELYSKLFYAFKDYYYKFHANNREALDYFFEVTD